MKTTILILILFIASSLHSQWVEQNSGSTTYLSDIYMFSETKIICVGQDGLILRTTNGGTNWNTIPSGTTVDLSDIFFLDNNTGWISGNGAVLKSINGGTTWNVVSNPSSGAEIFFLNQNTGWRGTNGTSIQKTTNGGTDWTAIMMPAPCLTRLVQFVNSSTGYAFALKADSTYIFKTVNGGGDWDFFLQVKAQGKAMQILGTYNIVVGIYNRIMSTTNGGVNWENSPTVNINAFGMKFLNSNTGYLCGDFGKIAATTNGGANWFLLGSPVTDILHSVYFMPGFPNTGFICGSNGKILKTTNGGALAVNQISTEVPSGFELKQNYPNPFNPVTNINFSIPQAANVQLIVFDATGREVAELINEKLSAGSYNYDFDAGKLSSGIYFYRMNVFQAGSSTGSFTEVKKMMLIK